MLRQALILKVFQGASRSRRDCGNLEAERLNAGPVEFREGFLVEFLL
jgi:hypothetical protein